MPAALQFNRLVVIRLLALDVGDFVAAPPDIEARLRLESIISATASSFATAHNVGAPRLAEGHLSSPDRLERTTIPPAVLDETAPFRVGDFGETSRSGALSIKCESADFFRTGVVVLAFRLMLAGAT